MKQHPTPWTPKAVGILIRMTRAGANSGEIAQTIGNGLTRNAVLGKAHRLRAGGMSVPTCALSTVKAAPKPPATPRSRAGTTHVGYAFGKRFTKDVPPKLMKATPHDTIDPKTPGLVRMMDLQPHSCRWPLNSATQGEYYFCGDLREGARPYCPTHVALAYDFRSKTQAQA